MTLHFFVLGNKRDKLTLEEIIVKRVRPGTTIFTDGWAAYKQIEKLGGLTVVFNFKSIS